MMLFCNYCACRRPASHEQANKTLVVVITIQLACKIGLVKLQCSILVFFDLVYTNRYKPHNPYYPYIGNRKNGVCLHLHGQVSRQPKRCRSAMLDPKGRALRYDSGSLLGVTVNRGRISD